MAFQCFSLKTPAPPQKFTRTPEHDLVNARSHRLPISRSGVRPWQPSLPPTSDKSLTSIVPCSGPPICTCLASASKRDGLAYNGKASWIVSWERCNLAAKRYSSTSNCRAVASCWPARARWRTGTESWQGLAGRLWLFHRYVYTF